MQKSPILDNEMDILYNGMVCCESLAPNYRNTFNHNRKRIKKGTKGIQSICSATHIRGVTKDLNAKIRVKIQKQPILNNKMNILNNGMDCCETLAPNYRYTFNLIRKLITRGTKCIQSICSATNIRRPKCQNSRENVEIANFE